MSLVQDKHGPVDQGLASSNEGVAPVWYATKPKDKAYSPPTKPHSQEMNMLCRSGLSFRELEFCYLGAARRRNTAPPLEGLRTW